MTTIEQDIEFGLRNMFYGYPERLKIARKHFENVLRNDPNNIEALHHLGTIYRYQKDYKSSMDYAEKIKKINPNALEGWALEAGVVKNLQTQEQANKIFEKIITISQNIPYKSALEYYIIGAAYGNLENASEATKYLQASLSINDSFIYSLLALAENYFDEKKYEEAIPLYKKLITLRDQDLVSYSSLGECYYNLKNYQEAIKYYELELSITGIEDFGDSIELANCYIRVGELEKALPLFTYYLKDNLDDVFHLTQCAYLLGNLTKTEENEEEKLSLKKSALNLLNIAYENFYSDDYDKSSLTKEEKKYIKGGFVAREQLRKEFGDIKDAALVYKDQVSFVIKHNAKWEDQESKIKYITSNSKLDAYHTTFRQVLDEYLVCALVTKSGKFQLQKPSAFDVANFVKEAVNFTPVLGAILNITMKAAEFAYETKTTNKAKRILSNLKYFEEAQKIIKEVAVEVTLKQEKAIVNCETKPSTFISKILDAKNKVKDKFIVNLNDTPEKMLAYKDASIMISLCQKSYVSISAGSTLEETFVDFIIDTSNKLEDSSLVSRAIKAVNHNKENCTVMAVTDIIYDNPILNNPEILKDAYEKGGIGLVNDLIKVLQPMQMSGIDLTDMPSLI